MKKFWLEFARRGLIAASGGPVILAIVYGILGATKAVTSIPSGDVCIGVLSITLMAFIAAGITAVYQSEKLPLISAILIHAGVLYLDYLVIYLMNNWMPRNPFGIGVFTGVFFAGFSLTWICIYFAIKGKTKRINQKLNTYVR
jgi:hypothetical protein